jgi:hypothetical protein
MISKSSNFIFAYENVNISKTSDKYVPEKYLVSIRSVNDDAASVCQIYLINGFHF